MWERVVVDHGRRDAAGVLREVPEDLSPDGIPPADPTAAITLARVSQQACVDSLESACDEMIPQDLIDERLLSLTFDVNEEPGHALLGAGPAAELVLFPELAEAVVLQPSGKTLPIESSQACTVVHPHWRGDAGIVHVVHVPAA